MSLTQPAASSGGVLDFYFLRGKIPLFLKYPQNGSGQVCLGSTYRYLVILGDVNWVLDS